MAKRFHMEDAAPRIMPMHVSLHLHEAQEGEGMADQKEYQELIGSLNHAAVYSRPDITNAVSNLTRYLQKPTTTHMREAQHTLGYLYTTRELQINYGGAPDINVHGYADANWGGDVDTRKSTTGYLFVVNNGAILRTSRRQTTVALFTMEPEYMALSDATREAIAKHQLMQELRINVAPPQINYPPRIHCDNQGTLAIAENPVNYQCSKHIDIRYHFVRHAIQDKKVTVTYIPTKMQIADILTKVLGPLQHRENVNRLFGPQRKE